MLPVRNHRYLGFMVFLTMILSLFLLTSAHALQGGPDKYGYRYIDSQDKYGPRFSWQKFGEDMVQLEGKLAVGDSLTAAYPIGFTFEFYGKNYSYFRVADNGYMVFNASMPPYEYNGFAYNGQSVPSSDYPNRMLAPLWSDNDGTA